MDADTLRSLQAPIKNKYKEDPNTAIITLRASGELDDQHIACKVETGRAMMVAGLHPATGGSGAELCSGDMLLEALVACAGVTLKAVATARRHLCPTRPWPSVKFSSSPCARKAVSASRACARAAAV